MLPAKVKLGFNLNHSAYTANKLERSKGFYPSDKSRFEVSIEREKVKDFIFLRG
jgi:hypothetical protein